MIRLQHVKGCSDPVLREAPLQGFLRREDGSFIIFGLIVFVLILMAGGLGVDLMRYEAHRARLQATLDRAVLAAGSMDQPLEPREVVLDYFARANLSEFIDPEDIKVVDTAFLRSVQAEARMEIPSLFMNFMGINELTAPASASAMQLASQTEISLVLDVSGSMGWAASGTTKTRIEVLEEAAEDFVNLLMCDPSNSENSTNCIVPKGVVALNIVPYSEQVLVGESVLSRLNATSEHNSSSCVTFDDADFETTAISDETPLQRTGHFDPWTGYMKYTSKNDPASRWTCDPASWREVVVLEDDVTTLQDYLDALEAGGNTSIDIGMKWGVALLDPAFQPVAEAMRLDKEIDDVFKGYPLSWETKGVQKVVVLMTDGVNTDQHYLYDDERSGPSPVWRTNEKVSGKYIYSVYRASNDEYYWPHLNRWEDHPYGTGTYTTCSWWWGCKTYTEAGDGAVQMEFPELWAQKPWSWYEDFWWLDYPGSWQDNDDKNARLADICGEAKADGMKIFTIGFDTDDTQDTILRNCASKPGYYYDANGLNLNDIFKEIAREVSKLQLVN